MSGIFNTPLVLIEDVAAELDIAESTLREWRRKNTFPHFKLAGKRRLWLRRDWIDAFLSGAVELEVEKHRGGRVVRPKGCRP